MYGERPSSAQAVSAATGPGRSKPPPAVLVPLPPLAGAAAGSPMSPMLPPRQSTQGAMMMM